MTTRRALRRLLALPFTELLDLVMAQTALVVAFWTLHWRRRGHLLHSAAPPAGAPTPCGDTRHIARMATAVDRAARFGVFRPTCLVRAIALERLLGTDAGPPAVLVGVRMDPSGLLAHAWIELGGQVIGDDPTFVRRFVRLHDFSALPR